MCGIDVHFEGGDVEMCPTARFADGFRDAGIDSQALENSVEESTHSIKMTTRVRFLSAR
jgi:hypothetical protein